MVFYIVRAAICLGVVIKFSVYQYSDLWPTPGLYFLEIILLALSILISRVTNVQQFSK